MIERVHINGFQSLADVELPLGGFTVIQGRSNSGKSAVIRALRAVVTNAGNLRGTNGSFIHQGSKECSVKVVRQDGTLVWTKSPTKTTYDLNGKTFQTGVEVPEEVADFLKLGDIVVDEANALKVNVNFQGGARGTGQFEPPFLVVDRAGSYLAKVFSLLTSANILYAAQAVAKKESRANAGKLKTLREVHETEQARLATLQAEYAPLHAAAERAVSLQSQLQTVTAERDRLSQLQNDLSRVDTELALVNQELARADVDLTARVTALDGQLSQLASYQAWHQAFIGLDQELAALDASGLVPLPDAAHEQLAEVESLMAQVVNLSTWHTTIQQSDSQLFLIDHEIEQAEEAAQAARAELTQVIHDIGVCPTCNAKMIPEAVLA